MMLPPIRNTFSDTLRHYQTEAETELYRILNFWVQHAPDNWGGFIGQMDSQGKINADAPKGSVLNARILWSFSTAYRHTKNPQYLQMAHRSYNYLVTYFLDKEYGGIYWEVTADGKPLNNRKQIYGLAFAIYGISEYHIATGNKEALEICQSLFYWIEKYSHDAAYGGYLEAFSRDGVLLHDLRLSPKDRNDLKTMNTHLHILEAYANLYRVWHDPVLGCQLESLIEIFLNRIIDRETGHLNLFFTQDWTATANLISYGHDIEASWLLVEAAEVVDNSDLLEKVKAAAIQMARATATGIQPDGSLFHEWNKDTNHYDTHREWWVSAEAMVGFLNAYQLTGEESFLHLSVNSWRFIQEHILDRQLGEWLWGVLDDYTSMISEDKISFWKCPYHNTRACLEIINRCQALVEPAIITHS